MARVAKDAKQRQDQILDVAHRLFAERGFSHTTVQAIIDAVGIAKGTFYHHFASKGAVLDALVMRLIDQSQVLVQPLLDDPDLDAIAKLMRYLQLLNAWKLEQRAFMLDLSRALRADANASMMKRLRLATSSLHVPIVARIVEQGVREGVFHTRYPHQAARIYMAILTSLSESLSAAMDDQAAISDVEVLVASHSEAVERVLGAPDGSLRLVDAASLRGWFTPRRSS